MRFAFISTMVDWAWGGSEELWSQTAEQLNRAGHDVVVSVVHRRPIHERVAALSKQGIKVGTHPSYRDEIMRRIWNKGTLRYRRTYSRLKAFKPDLVVISQGHNSGGFEWARVCREASLPYVLIVQTNSELWWFADREVDEAVKSYTAARKVFCVSRENLDLLQIQLGVPLENGEVVCNPYKALSDRIPSWPDESKVWRLACVGRLDPVQKAQDVLLRILARPEWRARPVELNLFGVGPYEQLLRRLCRMLELNNVHLRGHVNDVGEIWEQNHLLVQPSRYEGVPITVIEAMWCGRPAVVTDVGRMAELYIDGETGFVASAPTVSGLADTLERAWNCRADWQRMGQAARARAENQIPRDPIAVFAERLTSCVETNSQVLPSAKPS